MSHPIPAPKITLELIHDHLHIINQNIANLGAFMSAALERLQASAAAEAQSAQQIRDLVVTLSNSQTPADDGALNAISDSLDASTAINKQVLTDHTPAPPV